MPSQWSCYVRKRLRLLHAEENPFASTKTTNSDWQVKNPDAKYAVATDMCSGLPLKALATQAISNNPDQSKSAIDQLREEGPAGLDALMAANSADVKMACSGAHVSDPNWSRIKTAIDAVAMQRDAYASGLYWYTDMAKARAAARASGKPILSLRLLGNLNDEYSCANSRFFRTVLYANQEVSKELREKFILHWQSVRPVPVITIDFGDGRKIRRTITGNSIHYVLTADGKVIDGIPGLYGPKAFLRELSAAETQSKSYADETPAGWHNQQSKRIAADFDADCKRLGLTGSMTDSDWSKIAAFHSGDSALDSGSEALMAAKNPPDAVTAMKLTMSKRFVETPLLRMIRNFQSSIAQDTVRNEYLFHLQIHRWLADPANAALTDDVAALNKRVYAELFLTPDSDPWLGLVPVDTYSALDDDGLCH